MCVRLRPCVSLSACPSYTLHQTVKYTNAVVKNLATTVAIVLSSAISVVFFGSPLCPQFVAGAALVVAAVLLYGYASARKLPPRANSSTRHVGQAREGTREGLPDSPAAETDSDQSSVDSEPDLRQLQDSAAERHLKAD